MLFFIYKDSGVFDKSDKKESMQSGRRETPRMLTSGEYELVSDFGKRVLKDGSFPESIKFELSRQSERGDEYVGSWKNKDADFFVLYVKREPEKIPSYLRIWTLLPGENQDTSPKKILSLFFEISGEELICRETQDSIPGDKLKECGKIMTNEDGSKEGTVVRSPIDLPLSPAATMVGTCYIPTEFARFYDSKTCL